MSVRFHRSCQLLVVLMSCCLSGCLFTPDEDDGFVTLDPTPHTSQVVINLNDAPDTIDVVGAITLKYSITGIDPGLSAIIGYTLNPAAPGYTSLTSSGEFSYYPQSDSGYTQLVIRVRTNSGTGSLAERAGLETILYEKSWVLRDYVRLPANPKITSIERYQGSLKINWTGHKRINFKSYTVSRIYNNKTLPIKVITDPDSTFFVDHGFIGNVATYFVTTTIKDDRKASTPFSSWIDFTIPMLTDYQLEADKKLQIRWSPTTYPANFQRYEIHEKNETTNPTSLLYSTTDSNDTTYAFLPVFGKPSSIVVKTISKAPVPEGEVVESTKDYGYGEIITAYDQVLVSPANNRFFVFSQRQLRSYSIDENKLLRNNQSFVPLAFTYVALSKDEKTVYAIYDRKLYGWDASTLEQIMSRDLSSFIDINVIGGLGTTLDERILIVESRFNQPSRMFVYDPSQLVVEAQYVLDAPANAQMEFSDDGKYLLGTGYGQPVTIFKKQPDNTMQLIFGIAGGIAYFDPADNTKVIVGSNFKFEGSLINRWDLLTEQFTGTINTPDMTLVDMDKATGRVIGTQPDGNSIIYDYVNQQEVSRIGAMSDVHATLRGQYLYSNYGVRVKVAP